MKAIIQDVYGSTDVLELGDIDRPEIADDEVLVREIAAGVDRGVWHLMTGLPYLIRLDGYGLRAPKTPVPGADVASVVEALGKDVTRFEPGDEVLGIGKGTFAEYTRSRGQARAEAGAPHLRAGGEHFEDDALVEKCAWRRAVELESRWSPPRPLCKAYATTGRCTRVRRC